MDDSEEERVTGRDRFLLTSLRRITLRVAHGLPVRFGATPQRNGQGNPVEPLSVFARYSRAYFQRWLLLGALIGVVAGFGAIVFSSAIAFCTHLLLTGIAAFTPPAPAGEGTTVLTTIGRRWLIPVVTTLGGLLTGFIVFSLAPEAEGHGTDAAIEAFHEKGGKIRSRIPIVKLVASAITIGSGGSAGREGPTAQISAGFGSWLGDLLHLDAHDRRIAVAAGIGSGIGAIFKAPFGGALLSAEILYKRDFEVDALFPSFIASVVGFAIYGAWSGWTPVFGPGAHYQFNHVSSLLGYLILGVCAGLVGLLYPKTLYGMRSLFHRIHLPQHIKPAIGGLFVGLIGLFIPQALGMGYGYVQFSINSDFVHVTAWLMAILVFVKILTTSLTIGSGGSGGVFGPGMVIGGFLGGALWAGIHTIAPGLVAGTNAGAFAVVGMAALFGGVAKAPLAVILMVAEMTGEYSLVAPAMLATMVAYLITGETSIYESQVDTRLDSPAHKDDYALPLLQSLTVRDAMIGGVAGALAIATPETPVEELSRIFRERHVPSIPIIERGRLVGLVTPSDMARVMPATAQVSRARQVMSRAVVYAFPDESLYQAWLRMSRRGLRQLAIVDRAEPARLLGMVTADTIAQVLRPSLIPRTEARPLEVDAGSAVATSPHTGQEAGDILPIQAVGRALAPVAASDGHLPPHVTQVIEEAEDEEDGQVAPATHTSLWADQSGEASVVDRSTAGERDHATAQQASAGTTSAQPSRQSPPSSETDPLAHIRVADAMLKTPRLILESQRLAIARHLLEERGAALMIVDNSGRLVGIVTRSDLRGRRNHERGRALTVGDIAVRNLVTTRPNEMLSVAVRRMNRLGLRQLPVVAGELPGPPLGLLRRSDILDAYERAFTSPSESTVRGPAPHQT